MCSVLIVSVPTLKIVFFYPKCDNLTAVKCKIVTIYSFCSIIIYIHLKKSIYIWIYLLYFRLDIFFVNYCWQQQKSLVTSIQGLISWRVSLVQSRGRISRSWTMTTLRRCTWWLWTDPCTDASASEVRVRGQGYRSEVRARGHAARMIFRRVFPCSCSRELSIDFKSLT